MDGLVIEAGSEVSGSELVGRIEAAATLLERMLGMIEQRQKFLSGEIEKISATVETTRREEE